MASDEPCLQLHLEPSEPIEVSELTGALGALARQYQTFAVQNQLAKKPSDARLLVSSVAPGSIPSSVGSRKCLRQNCTPLDLGLALEDRPRRGRRAPLHSVQTPARDAALPVLIQLFHRARRFIESGVVWDFLAVSNSFTSDAEMDARQTGKPRGLVAEYDEPTKIRVWAKTCGQIIQEAEGRLTFYKRRLEYQANDAEALKYLKTINPGYLSEEVKAKIEAFEKEEAA